MKTIHIHGNDMGNVWDCHLSGPQDDDLDTFAYALATVTGHIVVATAEPVIGDWPELGPNAWCRAWDLYSKLMRTACIFEDVGGYYVCSDRLDYLDTRGGCHPTKAAAMRAAAETGYTHCVGSGTYHDSVRAIPRCYR